MNLSFQKQSPKTNGKRKWLSSDIEVTYPPQKKSNLDYTNRNIKKITIVSFYMVFVSPHLENSVQL